VLEAETRLLECIQMENFQGKEEEVIKKASF
jgi:hypothetical protein